ncbi:MAG: hypothetical protein Q9217_001409 [Psora testacea]
MALPRRSQQRPPSFPDIPATAVMGDPTSYAIDGATTIAILAETRSIVPTSVPSAPQELVAVSSSTPTTSASSSPTPAPHHGISPIKIVAIVVPIAALILLIPLVFLLYRSHQLKRAATKRQGKGSSREVMQQRQSSISKVPPSQRAPVGTRKPISRIGKSPFPRPANSLGLFNFDLSPPQSPTSPSPDIERTSPRLSIAHVVAVRRSEVAVIDNRRPSTRQANNIRSTMLPAEPPPPYGLPQERHNPHFAPLNKIGTAQARSTSRPDIHRNPSSQAVSALSRPSHEVLRPPPHAYDGKVHTPSLSPDLLPPITRDGVDWGGRFTISDYQRDETDRHSDQSDISSSTHHDGGTQPFRIL